MAVLALGFAGQALGGAIGGSLFGVAASAIGGFVGSTIGGMVDNMLFPQKAQGPRLDDLTVTASTYGNPIALLYGPENRIAGNLIWSSGLIETKRTTKQGGKGGPTVQTTEYSYRASFAIALAEGVVTRVRKVWANNKLIFDADAPASEVPSALYEAMRVYPGNFVQLPDPTVESYVGVGQTPAYRGTAYVVFQDLQLADYGNRLPNLEFLVEAQAEMTVSQVVSDVAARCGIDPTRISTMGGGAERVRGFAIGQASSGVGALQPLALAYDFDVSEVAGALRCIKRGSSPVGLISLDQLGGHDGSSERSGDIVSWSRTRVTALPRQSTVTFPDPDRDWQPNSQSAQRSSGTADNALSTSVPLVLTADQGRALADRLLWEAWTGQQTASTATDDRWESIEPGQIYYVETPAGYEAVRITRVAHGANGVIELDLRRDRSEVYLPSSAGVPSTVPDNPLSLPGLSTIILLDIPLLLDADETLASGFYWGVLGSGSGWRGADFLRSVSPPAFDNIAPQGAGLTMGYVDSVTPAPAPGYDSRDDLDLTTVIRVELARADMTLSGVTDDELFAGQNAIYLGPRNGHGGEIIQFGVADMVSSGVYDLRRLRRGQRGTEFLWGEHTAIDMLVVLEVGAVRRSDFGVTDLNLDRAYKAVSLLTLEVDTPAVTWSNSGVGLRPYSPVDLQAEGETGADVLMEWTRRSRIGEGVVPPPLAEESEAYVLQIRNLAGNLTLRTVNLTAPTFTYTTAMQTADFGAPVTNLRWRVAQVSAVYGNGPFAESNGPV